MKNQRMEIEDSQFVELLKSGDAEAFRRLVLLTQYQVVNTCYRFVLNREDAEDVAQEVFCEVFQSIPGFRGTCRLSTWIYRIATNRSLDFIRRRKRQKRGGLLTRVWGTTSPMEQIAAPNSTQPDEILSNRERLSLMQEAIGELPRKQQVAFTLKHVEGLSQKEIAEIMDVSVPAVESLMTRARENLRKRLQRYFEKFGSKPKEK